LFGTKYQRDGIKRAGGLTCAMTDTFCGIDSCALPWSKPMILPSGQAGTQAALPILKTGCSDAGSVLPAAIFSSSNFVFFFAYVFSDKKKSK